MPLPAIIIIVLVSMIVDIEGHAYYFTKCFSCFSPMEGGDHAQSLLKQLMLSEMFGKFKFLTCLMPLT